MGLFKQDILCRVVLVLMVATHGQGFPIESKAKGDPSFCRDLECPEYQVIKKTKDFEERCYAEYKWASTDMSGE